MITNVLQLLEKHASSSPQKTAVTDGIKTLTYRELADRSRCIGSALLDRISAGRPVGVYMEKSTDALCSFFGAVYAGGFYTMLSTELPDQRLMQIQSVLCAEVVITTEALREKAAELFSDAEIRTVEALEKHCTDTAGLERVRKKAVDTDPLYVNFTSGSTGVPKGIAVCHRSVLDFIGCFTELFGITGSDIIANQAPFDFDVSVKDIYSAMAEGAELVIVPRQLFSIPARLIDYLCEHKVTTMIWAVSALCLISTFHGLDYKTPETVNKILFSGEVMPYKHLREWQKHLPDVLYVNLYGPTEITCNCTYHVLEKDRDYSQGIPIGVSFPNEDVFLLAYDTEQPEGKERTFGSSPVTEKGKTGMITVRGTALALGYYKNPEKNAECFIQNPLNPYYPETVYLTGDLGMYNELGELVFCGRSDYQIKYMGHRIELEEIERAMSAIDGVERCFCMFDERKQRLKGYYVGTIEKAELHNVMKASLPEFMIPGFIRKVDEILLTKNGKIDRKKTAELIGGAKNG